MIASDPSNSLNVGLTVKGASVGADTANDVWIDTPSAAFDSYWTDADKDFNADTTGLRRSTSAADWTVNGTASEPWFTPQIAIHVAPVPAPTQVVYRFWSPKFNNAHFFTMDKAEADHVRTSDTNWIYEGTAFSAMAANGETCTEGTPVFRFYSPVFQSHFYTANADEKAHIIAADRNWNYEGVAYCAYSTQQAGTTAVYRFWSPGFGKHFFTASQAEADHIKAVDRNWNYEGIAYYVQP